MFGVSHFCKKNLFDPQFHVKSLTEVFAIAWEKVYLKDGATSSTVQKRSWFDLITHFFGLPFFSSGFFKDFFGWDEKRFLLPINILRTLFFVPLNLLLIIPRFILNLAKLITEFIPYFVSALLQHGINRLIDNLKPNASTHWLTKIFIGLTLVVIFPLYFASKLVHIVGRAITSPHQSLYAAWEAGAELAGDNILGKAVSFVFALISLALTTLCYLILFPLGIKLLITYAPTAIATGIQTILNFLNSLSFFGTALETVTIPIFNLIGIIASMPVISALAGIIGLAAGPFIVLAHQLEKALASFTNWWREGENTGNKPTLITEREYISRVLIQTPLGEGAYSTVYRGQYQAQTVAIKIIHISTQHPLAEVQQEWQNEFNIHSQLNSPYIVSLICACENKLTFVMEYMVGGTLFDLLKEKDFEDPQWQIRYQIGIDITFGVQYLHDRDIIHADLKSPNILLTSENRAKIADFGISSREKDSDDSRGTPNWAAPEVFSTTENNTKTSDMYSYGFVLWELSANGPIPFEGMLPEQVLSSITSGQRPAIKSDTPRVMQSVISQSWAQNPRDRLLISEALEQLDGEFQSSYQVKN